MKKYFMKGTEDELQFGDMVELDLTEDMSNGGIKHKHFECKFVPELVSILLEEGVIEEVDEEDEEDTMDEGCPVMEELIKANEALELRVDHLEDVVKSLKALITKVVA